MKSSAKRDHFVDEFYALDQRLAKLDCELQDVGERDLGDAVKRARRELELLKRLGIYEDREV